MHKNLLSITKQCKNYIKKTACCVFPVDKIEYSKFTALAVMMFCVIYNCNMSRILKDSLVVTSIGAEAISIIELFCVLPTAFLFTILYIKLTNILDYRKIFYIINAVFLVFFIIFGFILYPYQEYIHPRPATIDHLIQIYPHLKWQLKLMGKWSFTLFYIFSDLWMAIILNLLFWQFANHITKTSEARRFYPLIALIGAFAVTLAGIIAKTLSTTLNTQYLIQSLTLTMTIASIILIIVYVLTHKYIMTNPKLYVPKENPTENFEKPSIIASIKHIIQSHYLRMMVLIVLSYGITVNLIEGPWKSKIRDLYPTEVAYTNFNGEFIQWSGIIQIPIMLIGSYFLRRYSWFTSAIVTPSVMGITGFLFFAAVIMRYKFIPQNTNDLYYYSLMLIVVLGAGQIMLTKAIKYCLYDATKEMAYIPVDHEMRTKGKSAVDVVGSRLARSGGAFVQSIIFMTFPTATYDVVSPILMIIFMFIIYVWIYATRKLNKEYLALSPDSV